MEQQLPGNGRVLVPVCWTNSTMGRRWGAGCDHYRLRRRGDRTWYGFEGRSGPHLRSELPWSGVGAQSLMTRRRAVR